MPQWNPPTTPSRWYQDIWRFIGIPQLLLIGAGTYMLTALELNLWTDPPWFKAWVAEWRGLIIVVAIVLIVAPTPVEGIIRNLAARGKLARQNAEVSVAVKAVGYRTAYLIAKIREAADGTHDGTYNNHTLGECVSYFKTRRSVGGDEVDYRDVQFAIIYYERRSTRENSVFERKGSSGIEPTDVVGTTSPRTSDAARELCESIVAGKTAFSQSDSAWRGVVVSATTDYKVALAVPVRSGMRQGDEITGMVVILGTNPEAIREADAPILSAYGWHLAAAREIDSSARSLRANVGAER